MDMMRSLVPSSYREGKFKSVPSPVRRCVRREQDRCCCVEFLFCVLANTLPERIEIIISTGRGFTSRTTLARVWLSSCVTPAEHQGYLPKGA